DVDCLANECSGLGILPAPLVEVAGHPAPQVLGFADIDHLALGVLVEVHAGFSGNGANFREQVHWNTGSRRQTKSERRSASQVHGYSIGWDASPLCYKKADESSPCASLCGQPVPGAGRPSGQLPIGPDSHSTAESSIAAGHKIA